MSDLIFKGEIAEIKELIAKSNPAGMQTFDQALFNLYEEGRISYDDAIKNADSVNDIRLRIKLESKLEGRPDVSDGIEGMKLDMKDSDKTHSGMIR